MSLFIPLIRVIFKANERNSVNEIFDPGRVDSFYDQSPDLRNQSISSDKGTNYGVVRLELIEQIYHDLYMQRIKTPYEDDWQHRILPSRVVSKVSTNGQSGQLTLHLRKSVSNQKDLSNQKEELLNVDYLIVATGYQRNAHESMLKQAEPLRPNGQGWEVRRDYRLMLDESKVTNDAGLWLQGCNESTHGLSDSLLSILATRSGEMVQSIFGAHLARD